MNKIYKVKKNTAGNSMACSHFTKSPPLFRKTVLSSLLVIGALGMTTVASAQSSAPSIEQKLESLRVLQDIVQRSVGDNSKKITENKESIANNKTTLTQHAKQINENKQAIEAKLSGKADLQKLDELKTNVDKNQADIATNKAAADTKFATTQDAITKNAKDITKNTTSISALDTKVSGFDGRINALDTKVNTFNGRISALDAKVNGFDGRINALDDKFKNGMAVQAALNGLFQPYGIGKVSVSAAIGGYDSKSAIAIGAGYRVNPQLAFKGGTAINMSGSKKGSYNLGVNYEF